MAQLSDPRATLTKARCRPRPLRRQRRRPRRGPAGSHVARRCHSVVAPRPHHAPRRRLPPGHRLLHRQRCAPHHQPRPARVPGHAPTGGGRLRHRLRRAAGGGRPSGRRPGAPPPVPHRHGRLHRHVAGLRPRPQRATPRGRQGPPRCRLRHDAAPGPLDHPSHDPWRRAQPGARHVRRRRRSLGCRRSGAGRPAHLAPDIAGSGWPLPSSWSTCPVGTWSGSSWRTGSFPTRARTTPAPVDTGGTALLGFSLLCLLVPLTEGRSLGWPWWTWLMLAAAPVGALAFIRTERRGRSAGAVMPPRPPLAARSTQHAQGARSRPAVLHGLRRLHVRLRWTLQDGAGFIALHAGLILFPMALGFLGASLAVARLLARFGRRVLVAGGLVQATGLAAIACAVRHVARPQLAWRCCRACSSLARVRAVLAQARSSGSCSPTCRRTLAGAKAASRMSTATMQQGSLALGVATVGTAYLTLTVSIGALHAGLAVLGVLFVIALTVSLLAWRHLVGRTSPAASAAARRSRRRRRQRRRQLAWLTEAPC